MTFAMIMTSIPAFWLGLIYAAVRPQSWAVPGHRVDTWKGFVLPSATLAIGNMAVMIRMTRSTMLEVIREDYIRTAKAKGAGNRRVIMKHALRNALLPIVTTIGINFGLQMGGAMICEPYSPFWYRDPDYYLGCGKKRHFRSHWPPCLFVALTICIVTLAMDVLYSFWTPASS
jgi:peptide/nickel transport system permease protein